MNILLINPSQRHVYGDELIMSQIPLGLAYLAAVLKQAKHTVEIIDIDLELGNELALRRRLSEKKIELIGITTTTPTFNKALTLAQIAKSISNAQIVLGGIHVTMLPEESIAHPHVDFVIRGEGEQTILELVKALEINGDLGMIDGLLYKQNGKIKRNNPRCAIDNLDLLPFPDRDLFQHNRYTYPDSLYKRAAPMMTSRGCFGKCTYCLTPIVSGHKCRFRSAKNVVNEIEHLKENYGIKEVHFWDDNFIGQGNRVFQIRDELKKRKIKMKYAFPNGVRADFISKDILLALKEMGVYSVAIGVESGSQEILNSVNKNIKLDRIREAFRMLKKMKIETWAFFMFGLPGENAQTLRKTVDFAREIEPDVAKFHIFKPFPGSPLFRNLKDKGQIIDFNYDNYGFHYKLVHRLDQLQGDNILEWQKLAYKEFYLRPKKVIRHLLRLKSFYRIKLNIFIAASLIKRMFK